MRKVLTFLFIFTGTIFSIFILVVAMYSLIPGYRDTLSAAVASTDDIPVVTPDMVKELQEGTGADETAINASDYSNIASVYGEPVTVEDEEVALSDTAEKENKPIVIDKEYHEDCGTGKGYWVITYSDGSTVVE